MRNGERPNIQYSHLLIRQSHVGGQAWPQRFCPGATIRTGLHAGFVLAGQPCSDIGFGGLAHVWVEVVPNSHMGQLTQLGKVGGTHYGASIT